MMIRALAPFAPLFSKSVFQHVQVLVAGAILAPGCRTVSSALRAMGLDQHKRFHRYHRVLSRARWSSREVGRVLVGLLVGAFVSEGEPCPGSFRALCCQAGQTTQEDNRVDLAAARGVKLWAQEEQTFYGSPAQSDTVRR